MTTRSLRAVLTVFAVGLSSLVIGAQAPGAPYAPDPGIFKAGARMSFISNSYMGEWSGVEQYVREMLLASPIGVAPEMVPAREEQRGWYWGMGLASMTSALERVEREGTYDTCVFLNGPLETMREFARRLTAACRQVVLFVAPGGKNPRTLGEKLRGSVAASLSDGRTLEREFPGLLVVAGALIFYDLAQRPPVDVPRVDYLYGLDNIHQNGLGTLVNAFAMFAVMSGRSPVGLAFPYDRPAREDQKFMRGDTIGLSRPSPFATPGDEIPFPPRVRDLFQRRVLDLVQAWQAHATEFDTAASPAR
jgi:hypothetical protein